MQTLLEFADNKFRIDDLGALNERDFDFIVSVKNGYMGVRLNDCLLVLNVNRFKSYRIRLQNIGFKSKVVLLKHKDNIVNKEYLEKYFYANEDNPYAIQHFFNMTRNDPKQLNDLTQFPPLFFNKDEQTQRNAVNKLFSLAQTGDAIFTYDRKSGISRLIREIDKSMWSHVGTFSRNKKIAEVTTSGMCESDFSTLYGAHVDVGLYRLKGITAIAQDKIQEAIEEQLRTVKGYGWVGLFRIFLKKKFNINLKTQTSLSELIGSNHYELIGYA